jgi:hypothetical protein
MDTSTSSKTHSNTKKRKRSPINTTRTTRSMGNKTRSGNNYSNNFTSLSSSNNKKQKITIEEHINTYFTRSNASKNFEDARNKKVSKINEEYDMLENTEENDGENIEIIIHNDSKQNRTKQSNKSKQSKNSNYNSPCRNLNTAMTQSKTPLTSELYSIGKSSLNKKQKLFTNIETSIYNKEIKNIFNEANLNVSDLRNSCVLGVKEEQQMRDIWGRNVTDHAKSKDACCYLCKVKIDPSAPPEMEHIIACTVAFIQNTHYRTLMKYTFLPEDSTDNSVYIHWKDFVNSNSNTDLLKTLYTNINCKKDYNETIINTKFEDLFTEFKKQIKKCYSLHGKAERQFDERFTFFTYFIKLWLLEFAYSHHTCNQAKLGLALNDEEDNKKAIANMKRKSKSKTDKKVDTENTNRNIKLIKEGFIKHMNNTKNRINHIITTKTEVLTNYSNVTKMDSLALEPDPVKTAIIFVMKSLRSTVQYSISKSKGKK